MSPFLSVWMELPDILLAEAPLRFEDIEVIGTITSFEVLVDKVVGGSQPDLRFSIFIFSLVFLEFRVVSVLGCETILSLRFPVTLEFEAPLSSLADPPIFSSASLRFFCLTTCDSRCLYLLLGVRSNVTERLDLCVAPEIVC